MSKAVNWKYNDFIQSRKDKLTNILLSEIIFLKANLKRNQNLNEITYLIYGLDKLEYLLNKLNIYGHNMTEKEFDTILMFIYHIFREITLKLK